MRSTSTSAQTRKDWLLRHMGKGAEDRATLVAVFEQGEDRLSLEPILSPYEWEVIWTRTCAEAAAAVRRTAHPIIVCDERFADGEWKELWNELGKNPCPPEFILASRLADERLWAELLNLGGYNLLTKPFRPEEVIRTIHGALTEWQRARTARSTNRRLSMPAHV
jgi:DNA-binding NtrC family response regulator